MTAEISLPHELSFDLCLQYLQHSPKELLHRVEVGLVSKLLRIHEETVLFSIRSDREKLKIEFHKGNPSATAKDHVLNYITEWFDLETDLRPFYAMAKKDNLLKGLVKEYRGYRIVGQPDLFESLVWAVLGQQINLSFAYTLKERFVREFGLTLNPSPEGEGLASTSPLSPRRGAGPACQSAGEGRGEAYFLFPSAETVSRLKPEQLLALQFSRQKAAYTIGIAKEFAEGKISKENLRGLPLQEAKLELMKIKGIGNWTANYALMKTFRCPDAFPLEDAGLHNAIKNLLGLKSKPTLARVKRIFRNYKGWEAYATLYLWKSLG